MFEDTFKPTVNYFNDFKQMVQVVVSHHRAWSFIIVFLCLDRAMASALPKGKPFSAR